MVAPAASGRYSPTDGWVIGYPNVARESTKLRQWVILEELKQSRDSNAPPKVQDEEITVLSQYNLNGTLQGHRQHVVVVGIAAIAGHIQIDLHRLAVSPNALDEFINCFRRDIQPWARRHIP